MAIAGFALSAAAAEPMFTLTARWLLAIVCRKARCNISPSDPIHRLPIDRAGDLWLPVRDALRAGTGSWFPVVPHFLARRRINVDADGIIHEARGYLSALLGLMLLVVLVLRADWAAMLQSLANGGLAAAVAGALPPGLLCSLRIGWLILLRPYDPQRRAGLGYLVWVATVREGSIDCSPWQVSAAVSWRPTRALARPRCDIDCRHRHYRSAADAGRRLCLHCDGTAGADPFASSRVAMLPAPGCRIPS